MGFFFINIKTRSKKDGDLYMRDALREMVKNLAFERFKKEGSNEEYVRFRSNMKTNKKDIKTDDSDYMIDSKPNMGYNSSCIINHYCYAFHITKNTPTRINLVGDKILVTEDFIITIFFHIECLNSTIMEVFHGFQFNLCRNNV